MKNIFSHTFLAISLLGMSSAAFAAKPCEELKSEIDAKFQAKGVQNYTLDIVANGTADSGKQVGTCDGGTKFISYKRGAATPEVKTEAPAPTTAAPAAKP
ncbi:MAG: DUF1161 domain-containing protein [Sideroxydans sp.]|nr:DUF1161 domain-containing protein [Sideroxydans sp.]